MTDEACSTRRWRYGKLVCEHCARVPCRRASPAPGSHVGARVSSWRQGVILAPGSHLGVRATFGRVGTRTCGVRSCSSGSAAPASAARWAALTRFTSRAYSSSASSAMRL
eukprot:4326634-Pleurochrysis_carterae.AAC.3